MEGGRRRPRHRHSTWERPRAAGGGDAATARGLPHPRLALLLNGVRVALFKRTVQTIVYIPHFLSWVVLGGILIDVLSPTGLVNQVLGFLHIAPIFFLGSNTTFVPTVIVTNLWKEVGFATIVYLAALLGIDSGLYEAAAIDGAN